MPAELDFRFPEAPAAGEAREVADGVLWLRLPLPFRLNHVNIYLIEDGAGFALLDTGIDNQPTREIWEALLAGLLKGRPLTRIPVEPLPSRPHRPRRLARRTARPRTLRHADRISRCADDPPRSGRAQRRTLSGFLPAPWAWRGRDRGLVEPRLALSAHGQRAAAHLQPAYGRGNFGDRRPLFRGSHRRRTFLRAGDALLPRGRLHPLRRSGDGQRSRPTSASRRSTQTAIRSAPTCARWPRSDKGCRRRLWLCLATTCRSSGCRRASRS